MQITDAQRNHARQAPGRDMALLLAFILPSAQARQLEHILAHAREETQGERTDAGAP